MRQPSFEEKCAKRYQIYKWIDALKSGYGKHNGQMQPPTTANIAAFMTVNGCRKDHYTEKYGEDAYPRVGHPDRRVYADIKNSIYVTNRRSKSMGTLGTHKKKVDVTKENHLDARIGWKEPGLNAYVWKLNARAKDLIDTVEERTNKKIEYIKENNIDVKTKEVVIPDMEWDDDTKTIEIPRINRFGKRTYQREPVIDL